MEPESYNGTLAVRREEDRGSVREWGFSSGLHPVCQWSGYNGAAKVKVILLNVRRKCIIILCQIDTFYAGEDQIRSVGVNVYGSGHCM